MSHSTIKLLSILAIVAAALGIAASAAASVRDLTPSISSNWAGYAVGDTSVISGGATPAADPLTFTSVTATWVQPKATCTAGNSPSYSAFWVGLGGFSIGAQALEQIGTESDCLAGGLPDYFAWFELVPAPSTRINLRIRPGDLITNSVNVNGTDVLVQVKNRTLRTSFTRHLQMANPDLTSAEWIAEAPSACSSLNRCSVLPLADFGSVAFTRIASIANGHGGTLTDPAWLSEAIRLVPSATLRSPPFATLASTAGAVPGSVSPDGRIFDVSWLPNAIS